MQMRSWDPSAPAPAALCTADTTGRGASGARCRGVQVPGKAVDTEIMHDIYLDPPRGEKWMGKGAIIKQPLRV